MYECSKNRLFPNYRDEPGREGLWTIADPPEKLADPMENRHGFNWPFVRRAITLSVWSARFI